MADTSSAQHAELVERFRALVGKHKAVQADLASQQAQTEALRGEVEAERVRASTLESQLAEAGEVKLKLLDKARSLAAHGKDLRLQLEEAVAAGATRDARIAGLEAELADARASVRAHAAGSDLAERLRVRESQLEGLHAVVAELQVRGASRLLCKHA